MRQRGFTLIEVMIALVMFSMMMVAIISALRTFGSTGVALDKVTGRVDELRQVSGFLRQSISAALPVMRIGGEFEVEGERPERGIFFVGGPRELIWVAPLTGGAGFGGAHIMRLSHESDRLLLRWHPYTWEASAVEWGAVKPRVLLTEVNSFSLGYRSRRVAGALEPEWLETWNNGLQTPEAVRVNLKAGDRFWPELLVALDNGMPYGF